MCTISFLKKIYGMMSSVSMSIQVFCISSIFISIISIFQIDLLELKDVVVDDKVIEWNESKPVHALDLYCNNASDNEILISLSHIDANIQIAIDSNTPPSLIIFGRTSVFSCTNGNLRNLTKQRKTYQKWCELFWDIDL